MLKEEKSGVIMNHDVGYFVTSCRTSIEQTFRLVIQSYEGPASCRETREILAVSAMNLHREV